MSEQAAPCTSIAEIPVKARAVLKAVAVFVAVFGVSAGAAWLFLPTAAKGNSRQPDAELLTRVQELERQLAANTLAEEAVRPGRADASPDQIFVQASPAVVRVATYDARGARQSQGSGFLVHEKGLVVTNYHVIQKAHSACLILPDNSTIDVLGVAALDDAVDIAILKIAGRLDARPLELAPFELPPIGTKVYAIGNPLGLANTLSDGLVSALREREKYPVIQITTPISPGSSGGPLLRPDGKVCGVTTFEFRGGQNLNFAVPVAHVERLLAGWQDQKRLTTLPLNERFIVPPAIITDLTNERSKEAIPAARPGEAISFWLRGCWWKDRREYANAAEEFDRAIQIEPMNPVWRYYQGMAWMEFGDLDKAMLSFDQAVQVKSNDAGAIAWRGQCWLRKHQPDRALEDFNEAVKTERSWVTIYASRALAWSAKKDYDSAAADFETALRLKATASFVFRDFAWFLATCPKQEFRNGERALRLAKIAADMTKWKSGPELNALAAAFAETGQFDQAARYQGKALEDPACLPVQHDYVRRLNLYKQGKPFRDEE